MPSFNGPKAYALKGNTISTSAVPISDAGWSWGANDLAEADLAIVSCNTNGVTLTYEGTDPTATLGIALAAGDRITIKHNANVQNIKLIRSGGSDALVTIQLEKH
jgi:hypothetical protein